MPDTQSHSLNSSLAPRGQPAPPEAPVVPGLAQALGLAADVGGTFVKFAAVLAGGRLAEPVRVSTPAADWEGFCRALAGLCAGAPAGAALSLSIAGVVDSQTGLALSANVPCITGRRLAAELEEALGRPVLVANDADCFVLAESLRGAATGRPVVFGIILGSGVGGGLVVHGRIVEGAGGIAGEWGHGPILGALAIGEAPMAPLLCGCGQVGCLDTIGSARGMERIDAHLQGVPGRPSRRLVEDWQAAEPGAARAVEVWVEAVAGPLAMMVNATGAWLVPVGGGLANSAPLVACLDAAVRARILRRTAEPILVPSWLGDEAGLLGAALRLDLASSGEAT